MVCKFGVRLWEKNVSCLVLGRGLSSLSDKVLKNIEWSDSEDNPNSVIVFEAGNFDKAKSLKTANGNIAVFAIQSFDEKMDLYEAIEKAYADLLQNRFSLSVGVVGDKGFILTGERGLALAESHIELANKFELLFKSRSKQNHNKTVMTKVDAFPAKLDQDCAEICNYMMRWEKLALFPAYQSNNSNAVYQDAEFGFVAKRTSLGSLITARASNKTNPSHKDLALITDITDKGEIHIQSLGRKASLNGSLAHFVFQQRPEVNYILHSHIFLPEGINAALPSAPGTEADWKAIEGLVKSGAYIINQPYHGCLVLLESPDDLLPILKRQSLYQTQSVLYDTAYARFQSSEQRQTSLERFIASLKLPKDTKILDMCCGTGASTQALKDLGFNNIDFADGSASMLAVAEKRHGKTGRVVKLERIDTLAGENYELITIRQAFNYVLQQDLEDVFTKMAKVLASGGHFVFNSFLPLSDSTDRRYNVSQNDGVIAYTYEINDVVGDTVCHAQRSEIIDFGWEGWIPVLDINEFYQHAPEDVVELLNKCGFKAEAHISGKSVCYHARKFL